MRKKCEKNAKKCEKLPKKAKKGPNKEGGKNIDGLRVPSSRRGEALPTGELMKEYGVKSPTRWWVEGPPRIETLRGPARGSNLEALPQQGQMMPSISQIYPLLAQRLKILPNSFPNPSQTVPKSMKNRPKIDPRGLLEPILGPCWHMFEKS